MQREVRLPQTPRRIVSLVPSQTELLFYLGLEEEVVGITKFCVHPREQWKKKTRVGGTKQYHFDRIAALQPDLIIGNKEENDRTQVEQLMEQYPVWMSDIQTVEDAFSMIEQVGVLVGKPTKAQRLIQDIRRSFAPLSIHQKTRRAAYFIWNEPMMVAGSDTFINEMMSWAGFENVFHNKKRYPSLSKEELQEAAPEVILLSSEPFPFGPKHLAFFKEICPKADVRLVDGELFSWYGPRLLHSAAYFSSFVFED